MGQSLPSRLSMLPHGGTHTSLVLMLSFFARMMEGRIGPKITNDQMVKHLTLCHSLIFTSVWQEDPLLMDPTPQVSILDIQIKHKCLPLSLAVLLPHSLRINPNKAHLQDPRYNLREPLLLNLRLDRVQRPLWLLRCNHLAYHLLNR